MEGQSTLLKTQVNKHICLQIYPMIHGQLQSWDFFVILALVQKSACIYGCIETDLLPLWAYWQATELCVYGARVSIWRYFMGRFLLFTFGCPLWDTHFWKPPLGHWIQPAAVLSTSFPAVQQLLGRSRTKLSDTPCQSHGYSGNSALAIDLSFFSVGTSLCFLQ